jgi:hypothetical protein
MASRAPAMSGAQNSHTEASKPMGVRWSTTSSAVRGSASAIQRMWLAMARCGIITPFGRPVEPEVYRMYARSPGAASGSSGSSTAWAISSASVERQTTRAPSPASRGATAASAITAAGAASAIM